MFLLDGVTSWCDRNVNRFLEDEFIILSPYTINSSHTVACLPEQQYRIPKSVLEKYHPAQAIEMLEIDDTYENYALWSQQELECKIDNSGNYYWAFDELDQCEPRTCQINNEIATSQSINIMIPASTYTHFMGNTNRWFFAGDPSLPQFIPGGSQVRYMCPNEMRSAAKCSSNLFTPYWIGSCASMLP